MTRMIEIVISPKGSVTVQTKGFSGASCREESRFIEEALGKLFAERLTAEFYQTEATTLRQEQRT